ncbi:MAG: hypothetical protein OXE17_03120 [Chloroflexi bacterium]|nr:hypothetical protein [Chloroflexota bacterium]
MARYNIVAGSSGDISLDSNEWLIIDIGYGQKSPTNAIWRSDETLRSLYFRQIMPLVTETASLNPDQSLHLAVEAPLSAAFDGHGEPTIRPCDEWLKPNAAEPDTRLWCNNAGASTLVLAEFLLRDLHEENIGPRRIKLFEGHVSFKYRESHKFRFKQAGDNHQADVLAIKHEIKYRTEYNIFDEAKLRRDQDLTLKSPFGFLNEDLIPPVIRVPPPYLFR